MNKANKIIIGLVGLALLAGLVAVLWYIPSAGLAQFRSPLETPSSAPAWSPSQPLVTERPTLGKPTPLPPISLPTPRITPTPPASLENVPAYDSHVLLRAGGIALAAVQSFEAGDSITFKTWSPDGERFLFGRSVQDYVLVDHGNGVGTHASWHDLWIASVDGSVQHKLADIAGSWAWSPNGRYIAYLTPANEQGVEGILHVADTKRWESREIATCDLGGMGDLAWLSTDEVICRQNGVMYAVESDGDRTWQLNSVFTFDSIPDNLMDGMLPPVFQGDYRISPDGEKMAYFYRGYPPLWVSSLDGSGTITITESRFHANSIVWSPDSKQLAYVAPNGNGRVGSDLWVVNADGSNLHRVTVTEYEDARCLEPAWSPDGKVIAYTYRSHLPSEPESVWVVNVDGTDSHLLVNLASTPQWSPRGNEIAVLRRVAIFDTPESLLVLVSLGQ